MAVNHLSINFSISQFNFARLTRNMATEKHDTRKFLLEVIDLYKQLPALWKIKSDEYSIRAKKDEAYTILLRKYQERYTNATKEDLKKKLNIMRTNFRKELRKVHDSVRSGAGIIYVSNVWYYDAMMFLCDQEMPTQFRSTTELDESQEIKGEPCHRLYSGNMSLLGNATNSATKAVKRKRIEAGEIRDEPIVLACERLRQPEDYYLNIAKTWAHELSQMCPQQQLLAKKAINDIIFEGQCGTLCRDSVQNNITTYSGRSSSPHGYIRQSSYSTELLSPSQDMTEAGRSNHFPYSRSTSSVSKVQDNSSLSTV